MHVLVAFFFFYGTAVSSMSVDVSEISTCRSSYSEYQCSDGGCVNVTSVCDGTSDCKDGSDETACETDSNPLDVNHFDKPPHYKRLKRQLRCNKNQWQCKDGTCISFDGKCDGVRDCPDGSDETFPLCRKNKCYSHWFRCAYGACVDGTAPCNNVQDCADNSDELLPACRNETVTKGGFTCADGSKIPAYKSCDGAPDCPDGSDETLRACAGKICASYLFQCAYGACVDAGSDCNGVTDCADGSDESDELCLRSAPASPPPPPPVQNGACLLPPFPEHGSYIVAGNPTAQPGQAFDTVAFNITCHPGYGIIGKVHSRVCFNGLWAGDVGRCVKFCLLRKDDSVEYRCFLTEPGSTGTRPCGEYEPDGTIVEPKCNEPNYYFSGVLGYMRCIDGSWDYVARCHPGSEVIINIRFNAINVICDGTNIILDECGLATPDGTGLIAGPEGRPAERGELPWHTGIYRKTTKPYMQICGGSLVRANLVISAAHCFWDDETKAQPASNYAVALGKIYRLWNHMDEKEFNIRRSDVKDLYMPARFQGGTTNFQDDIAVLKLETNIKYDPFIRPICLNFDVVFERRQLKEGNKGVVAGWGLTGEHGGKAEKLRTIRLPYISILECQSDSPADFRVYITGDKICAGFRNGSALCEGDSGGGLAFSDRDERGFERYYLRGIVSTAPDNGNLCNINWLTTFTQISRHEHFVKPYL